MTGKDDAELIEELKKAGKSDREVIEILLDVGKDDASDSIVREPFGEYGNTALREDERYTIEDYYALPDDQRVELIDGRFYDMGAPAVIHQIILGHLLNLFFTCAEEHGMPCEVLASPLDVRLDKDNYTMVQPDLMVFCHGFDIRSIRYEGAPDLVVEILSPSSRKKDMILKLQKYQKAGVREYWIVDPEKRAVTVHFFETEDYDPEKYSFDDDIPVRISDGQCSIDFSEISRRIAAYYK